MLSLIESTDSLQETPFSLASPHTLLILRSGFPEEELISDVCYQHLITLEELLNKQRNC